MAKIPLTLDEFKLYFQGNLKHSCYPDTVDVYDKLKVHAFGEVPERLINKRRPSESEDTMAYRKEIYVPKTKNPITKVVNSLAKIRRSPDWSINYKDAFIPASVVEEEQLQEYCENSYPGYESVTNWIFSVLLQNMCVDPNSIVAIFPKSLNIQENEYFKPVAVLFNSDATIFFEEGEEFAILKSSERSSLIDIDQANSNLADYNIGGVFYVFTKTYYAKYEQVNTSLDFNRTEYYEHNFGKLPVFKVPAQFWKNKGNTLLQESRLAPMIPHLDEAAREYSDLQAAKVMHMYPLMWYYTNKKCGHCGGTGKVINQNNLADGPVKCTVCDEGRVKFSPYAVMSVDIPQIGEQAAPTPPAGYVNRDVEIIKHQEESCKVHLYEALSGVNMQFLDQTPLNISGEAKNVDREELNNFVYSYAEDLVRVMDRIYYWINEWRYSFVIPDKKKRLEMLPRINVPENFDLLPADYLIDEITKGKTGKVNPVLIAAMEHDYAVKKFYNNPEVAEFIGMYFDLDPLPALGDDDKMLRLSNKGVAPEDYVISCNLYTFIQTALLEKKDAFRKMDYNAKMAVLRSYAQAKMKVISDADKVKIAVMQEAMNNNPGQPNNLPQ